MFEGLMGLISGISIGSNSDAQYNGTALKSAANAKLFIDKIKIAYDAIQIAYKLGNGDVAGLVKDLIGISADEIKNFKALIFKAGLSNLDSASLSIWAGVFGPVVTKFSMPQTGTLGKLFKVLAQTLGRSDAMQEKIGEIGAMLLTSLMNFKQADLPRFPDIYGPDFFSIQMNTGIWAMIEAKGGRGYLAKSTSYGAQFQWDWINYWYQHLADDNKGTSDDGKALYADYYTAGRANPKPLLAVVVSLNLSKQSDQLKMGLQPWIDNKSAWNNWDSKGPNRF